MKTIGWIAVLVVATWGLGSGVAAGSEDKVIKLESKTEGKDHHGDNGRAHARGEHKADHKVNINEASKADLMKLDGISAGVAQKIIAYREAHGPFKRTHDLEKVDGVAKDVFERNAGRITVK